MPKFMDVNDIDAGKLMHGFKYTSVRVDRLGATEYTAVTIIVDETGSVHSFKKGLEDMIKACVESCKKSPRSQNLLIRIIAFNSDRIREIHGWMLLNDIELDKYNDSIFPGGITNLYDATLDGIVVLKDYLSKLYKSERIINANGIVFIITDGDDNNSEHTPVNIRESIADVSKEEVIESIQTILIGLNDTDVHFKDRLSSFCGEAGIDEYVSIGEVSPEKLAKLSQFISQSVSSQSIALGTGQPSKPIKDFKF